MFKILILGRTEENAVKQLEDYLSKLHPFEYQVKKWSKYIPSTVLLNNETLVQAVELTENCRAILGDFLMIDSTIEISKYWMPYPDYFARHSPLPRENRVVYFSPY